MNRRVAAVALAIVAVLAALVWWALRDDAPDGPPSGRTGTAAPAGPAGRHVPPPTPTRPKPMRPATPATDGSTTDRPDDASRADAAATQKPSKLVRTTTLRVLVRRSSGAPAAGADVLALDPLGPLLDPPSPTVRVRVRADGDGRANVPVAGGTTVVRLLASLEGEAAVSPAIDVGNGRDRDVTLDLGLGLAASAHVQDAQGAPIAGATVELRSDDATWPLVVPGTSDAGGDVSFPPIPDVPPNAWLSFDATAPRHTPSHRIVRPSAAVGVVIVMDPAVAVRGRVVDEAGVPVAGATVRVVGNGIEMRSAADGTFDLVALPPTESGAVVIAKEGYAATVLRDLRGDQGDVLLGDVALRAGGDVTGIVLDAAGAPVPGAEIQLALDASDVKADATTGDDGRFVVQHVGEAPHTLTVTEPRERAASWSTRRRETVTDVRPSRGEIRVTLDGRATVVLRFLNDADRSPVVVNSAKLTATAVGATPTEAAWAWSGSDLSSIRFQPDGVGVFDLKLEIPGWDVGVARGVEVAPDRETQIDVLFRRR